MLVVQFLGKLMRYLSEMAFEGAPAQGHKGIRVFQALGHQCPNKIFVVDDIVVHVDKIRRRWRHIGFPCKGVDHLVDRAVVVFRLQDFEAVVGVRQVCQKFRDLVVHRFALIQNPFGLRQDEI